MKIGDLVKDVSPWTKHNPWMIFDDYTVGVVVEVTIKGNVIVLWAGKDSTTLCHSGTVEVINESR